VADVTGQVWRFRNQTWEEITEKLPVGTRKYAEMEIAGTSSRIAAQGRNLVWINPPGGRALFAQGHGALLSDLLVSRRSGTVYSAALDGGLRVWSLNDFGARAKTFRGWDFKAGAAGIVFSEDGRQLCLPLTGEASVTLDAASLTPKWETAGIIFPAALTTRGLLGVGSRTDLHFVDPATGTVRSTLSTAERRPRLATANADGNQVAVIDHGGDLLSVAADRGPVTIRSSLQRNILIALNRAGDRLWTTATNRELLCLSWPEGRVIWRETLPAIAPHLLLLPDQRHLIVALETGNLEVRDAGTGVLLRTIGSESAAPQSLAATPDGKRLFAAGIEGDIHCFDPATWNYLHSLPLHTTERLHVLVCSPDGKTLAALTKTGTLHVLRTE
jgi:WD40 repeat protein